MFLILADTTTRAAAHAQGYRITKRMRSCSLTLCLFAVSFAQDRSQPPSPIPRKDAQGDQKKTQSQKKRIDPQNEQAQPPVTINQFNSQPDAREKTESAEDQKHNAILGFINAASPLLLAVFTLLLAGATAVLAWVALLQLRTMKEHAAALASMKTSMEHGLTATQTAANAAKESVEAAKQSFVLSHRPKLGIRFMSATSTHGNFPTSGTCQVFNSGDTNAVLDRQWFEISIGGHLPAISPYQGKHGEPFVDVTLVPGNPIDIVFPTAGPRAISTEEYGGLGNHREYVKKHIEDPRDPDHLFVIGWISYRDEMNEPRTTGFCQRYNFRTERFERVQDPDYEYGDLS